jgi:hypothetical protein
MYIGKNSPNPVTLMSEAFSTTTRGSNAINSFTLPTYILDGTKNKVFFQEAILTGCMTQIQIALYNPILGRSTEYQLSCQQAFSKYRSRFLTNQCMYLQKIKYKVLNLPGCEP